MEASGTTIQQAKETFEGYPTFPTVRVMGGRTFWYSPNPSPLPFAGAVSDCKVAVVEMMCLTQLYTSSLGC
eukprot:1178072-Prorocentrum_minimum.AAC.7